MKSKSMFYAKNKSTRIILSILFFFVSFTAFSQSGEKWSTGCNTVSGNAALGTINNFPLIIKTNNTQKAVFTPFGYFGLGITAPTCMLDVNGDGRIINFNITSNLTVGNLLTVKKIVSPTGTVDFDGSNIKTEAGINGASLAISGTGTLNNISISQNATVAGQVSTPLIVSPTGTVDFDGNKIKTHKSVTAKRIILTGDSNNISSPNETINFSDNHISTIGTINGGSLNITGTITANNINVSAYSNPVFAGSGNGIVTFDNNGSFQKLSFNNDANTILLGNGTFGALPANGWTINGNDMYSIPAGNIGIGTTNPVAKLDINGDANISGYLYVQNGVIIGKRVNSEKVITDTVKVKEITADTVKASKTESTAIKSVTVEAKQMTAEKITIDTLLTAKLDLQKMTADSVNTQKIQTSEIKVGNILTIDGGTGKITSSNGNVDFGNNILTTTGSFNANSLKPNGGPLYIQNSTNDIHTLINANNNGYVGIGTDAPIEKLDVAGNANIRGYLYVQDGVIIGKRVNSEKVVTDTAKVGQVEIDKGKIDSLASKQITVDSLKTKDIKTEQFTTQKISSVNITTDSLKATQFTLAEMHADSITAVKMTLDKLTTTEIKATVEIASKDIKIDEKAKIGNNIVIDGPNSIISATNTSLFFQGTDVYNDRGFHANWFQTQTGSVLIEGASGNIKTTGKITADTIIANNLAIPNPVFDSIQVVQKLKIGTSTLILDAFASQTGVENSIYTESGNLLIQSQNFNNNTIINANNTGNVGIGTNNPQKKLHVKSSVPENVENPPSEYMGSIRVEHDVTNVGNSTWDLEPIVNNTPGYYNRFSIGTPGNTSMFSINENGNVGIGTSNPGAKLEVNGTIKITDGSQQNNRVLTCDNTGKGTWKDPDLLFTEKWQSGTGANIFRQWGNVGIGTNTPEAKLHIKIMYDLPQDVYGSKIEVTNNNHSPSQYIYGQHIFAYDGGLFGEPGSKVCALWAEAWFGSETKGIHGLGGTVGVEGVTFGGKGIQGISSNGIAGYFNSTDGGYGLIVENGNVGIGTLDPNHKLTVKGNINIIDGTGGDRKLLFQNKAALTVFNIQGAGANTLHINHNWSSGTGYYSDYNIVSIWGNVGIGTESPSNKLEVITSKNDFDGIKIDNSLGADNVKTGIAFYNDGNDMGRIYCQRNNNDFVFQNIQAVNSADFVFKGPSAELARITKCGNFYCNGNIWAKEVKVKSSNPYTCDFVFDKGYKLQPILEIEEFIIKNKHLPGVPSAKEIENNGTDLQKMDGILLQKIEELTLYIIQLQKELESVKKSNK